MAQPEALNQFPDLVSIKLHSIPVSTNEIELKATVRFHEQVLKVPGGLIWFGLKRGELKLFIDNGRIPLEKMGLIAPFETEIELEVLQETSKEVELQATISGGFKNKGSHKIGSASKHKTYQCYTKGTETSPIWFFEARKEIILVGQLTEVTLGRLEISSRPCSVRATFEVRTTKDLHLIRAEGLLPENIGTNKLAVLERELFFRFVASKITPRLSQVEEKYE